MTPELQYEPERLYVPVKFKATEENNIVEGYASVFGVLDSQDDIVMPGAFRKTIQERVPRGLVKFLSGHDWSVLGTLGTVVRANEDNHGLMFHSELSNAPSAQDARIKMIEGHINRLSIGYGAIRERWERNEDDVMIRYLDEIKLWEVSAVPFAANEEARITLVKAVVSYQNFSLASRSRTWDKPAAENRVRAWAGADDEPNAKYRSAFVWYDRDQANTFGAYKLLIADVVNGTLTAVPKAIFASAAAVQGARGGLDVPEGEVPGIKHHLERYYKKMASEFDDDTIVAPWNKSMTTDEITDACNELLITAGCKRVDILRSLAEPVIDPLTGLPAEPGVVSLTADADAQEVELLRLKTRLELNGVIKS